MCMGAMNLSLPTGAEDIRHCLSCYKVNKRMNKQVNKKTCCRNTEASSVIE